MDMSPITESYKR